MIHSVYLAPLGSGDALDFIWDDEQGTVNGASAEIVLSLIAEAKKDGFVISHPWPTSYPISDPLHNLAEMAAIVSSWSVRLPDEWAEAMASIAPVSNSIDDKSLHILY